MSETAPPVETVRAPCPECGRSMADYLTMGEVYDIAGYARSNCTRCILSDWPGSKADQRLPSTDHTMPWTPTELLSTTDADAWADAFCRVVGKDARAFRDKQGNIAAWFANAIKAGEFGGDREGDRREIDIVAPDKD